MSGLPQVVPIHDDVTIADPSLPSVLDGKKPPLVLKASGSAHLEPSPTGATSGSIDHREADFGAVYTIALGQNQSKDVMHPSNPTFKLIRDDGTGFGYHSVKPSHHPTMRDLPFP